MDEHDAAARRRRERRFDDLYAAYRQTLHAYFLGRTGDAEVALDLVQDTFVRVWRSLDAIGDAPAERQRAWLFSIARNLVVDVYRGLATRRTAIEALEREQTTGARISAAADASLTERERVTALNGAIRRLPEDLRVVLVLQVVGERNSSEIGELLGRPAGTVRYQLLEARRRLAADLELVDAVKS